MPRTTNAGATRKRRKRILKQTRGYFGNKSRLYRYAIDAFWRAGCFAYRDRKRKKTEFRQLWIVRINAACRPLGIPYGRFMEGLKAANIELDRKSLSELAIHDAIAFAAIVEKAKEALKNKCACPCCCSCSCHG
ncbi:MAG: 50S ribosomal protein L20 [Puniceicoccales bacterium]|jgi:large subunit ribosomal protein L20|nr:50S ribosomal protein L20 [Puniceicoccales bacterium]